MLPWRQNLSSCGDSKWPVKLQFQGSVRSAEQEHQEALENCFLQKRCKDFFISATRRHVKYDPGMAAQSEKQYLWLKEMSVKSEWWPYMFVWIKSKSLSVKANKHEPLIAEQLAFHALAI